MYKKYHYREVKGDVIVEVRCLLPKKFSFPSISIYPFNYILYLKRRKLIPVSSYEQSQKGGSKPT